MEGSDKVTYDSLTVICLAITSGLTRAYQIQMFSAYTDACIAIGIAEFVEMIRDRSLFMEGGGEEK
jgi:hypothetical protein